jgi:excisionase family DNA binding protein
VTHPTLMTPREVAALAGVNAKTVSRWEKAGLLAATRTLGGHRRFVRADVEAALERAATAERHECERCGASDDVVAVTFARGEAADGGWFCRGCRP